MSGLALFTLLHTAISLLSIPLGILVVSGLFHHPQDHRWSGWFLAGAIAATLTGFLFPFVGVTPAFATGIVSTLVLAATIFARYVRHGAGRWGTVEALGMLVSLYLLVFVTIAQAFLKIPPLRALAPTGSEPPFAVAQLICLAGFAYLGFRLMRGRQPV